MNVREKSILVISLVWLFFIVLFGILAIRFNYKYKRFIGAKNKQEEEFNSLKDIFKLGLINIAYDLPEGEVCYLVDAGMLFKQKNKEKKLIKKYNKTLLKNNGSLIEDDDELKDLLFLNSFVTEKKHYSLSQKTLKRKDYEGKIYVTNERILIEEKEKSYQIPLDSVKSINLTIITYKNELYPCIYLENKEGTAKYYITYQNISLYFAINGVLKNEFEK